MKNSVKLSLLALSLTVISGVALTFCSPKSEKQADTQDTATIDTASNPVDSTATEAPQDSTAAQ